MSDNSEMEVLRSQLLLATAECKTLQQKVQAAQKEPPPWLKKRDRALLSVLVGTLSLIFGAMVFTTIEYRDKQFSLKSRDLGEISGLVTALGTAGLGGVALSLANGLREDGGGQK